MNHMKKRILCLFLALVFLCGAITACTSGDGLSDTGDAQGADTNDGKKEEAKEEKKMLSKEKSYSILFIGNSYTYYNDMPSALFAPIAEEAGYRVEVTAITKGAHTLAKYADPADEYGAKVEAALTGEKKYDFVILQEQSLRPAAQNPASFYSAVRNLSERIRATGAEPILYATWGRKAGASALDTYGWTNESMTWRLAAGYTAIGKELNIPVVHVGLAFRDAYANGTVELYNADLSHPSYAGSYLAAMTLFAGIFGVDPMTVAYDGSLSLSDAEFLSEAAYNAVFETPDIPEEYTVQTDN